MIQDAVREKLDSVRGFGTEDILAALGLERRRSALETIAPAIALFATGALVGAGAALLFAPRSGRETRQQLKGKASELSEKFGSSAGEMLHEARDAIAQRSDDVVHRLENGGRPERKASEQEHRTPPHGPSK